MATEHSVVGTPSLLRSLNDRTTAGLLFERGTMSKTELAAATGLSKPTTSQSLQRLGELGLVVTAGSRSGRPGPAAQLYEIDPAAGYAVSVDIANDGVSACICGPDGDVIATRVLAPGGEDATDLIEGLFNDLVDQVSSTERTTYSLVAGLTASYDADADVVRHAEHLDSIVGGLTEVGFARRLRERIRAAVRIENDVKLVALAESATGAASGAHTSVLLWAESGLGAAAVIGGRIHGGATGSAGEVGYLPVPGAGRTRAGDPGLGLQRWAGRAAVEELGRRHGLDGGPIDMILTAAREAAPRGSAFLTELADRYATGLASFIAVLDPNVVVLSGSYVFAGGEVLTELVADSVAAQAMRPVPVVLGELREAPVLTGARLLARRRLREALLDLVGPAA